MGWFLKVLHLVFHTTKIPSEIEVALSHKLLTLKNTAFTAFTAYYTAQTVVHMPTYVVVWIERHGNMGFLSKAWGYWVTGSLDFNSNINISFRYPSMLFSNG